MTERDKGPERPHPGIAVYEKMGIPELIGERRQYHGRWINAEDYFLQPDIHARAQAVFRIAVTMPADSPDFPAFQAQFRAFAEQYLGGPEGAQS